MRTFSLLCILSLSSVFAQAPKHIVQDLPPEMDPRLQVPTVNEAIVRPLTNTEAAEQTQLTAPISNIPALNEECATKFAEQTAQDAAVEEEVRIFCASQPAKPHKKPATTVTPAKPATTASASENTKDTTATEAPTQEMDVTCDDGMYLDSEKGLLVYLNNVHLVHPDFTMDCDNQLKIYLEVDEEKKAKRAKDQAEKKGKEKESGFGNMNMDYSGIKTLSADGNIRLTGKDKEGKPFKANAEKLTYNDKTGEIILTGNNISVEDAKNKITAIGAGSFIRIYESGDVYIKGPRTQTTIKEIQSQKDKKPKGNKK